MHYLNCYGQETQLIKQLINSALHLLHASSLDEFFVWNLYILHCLAHQLPASPLNTTIRMAYSPGFTQN